MRQTKAVKQRLAVRDPVSKADIEKAYNLVSALHTEEMLRVMQLEQQVRGHRHWKYQWIAVGCAAGLVVGLILGVMYQGVFL